MIIWFPSYFGYKFFISVYIIIISFKCKIRNLILVVAFINFLYRTISKNLTNFILKIYLQYITFFIQCFLIFFIFLNLIVNFFHCHIIIFFCNPTFYFIVLYFYITLFTVIMFIYFLNIFHFYDDVFQSNYNCSWYLFILFKM